MEISRVSAIVIAMLAAVLIIVAAKSCADDARAQNAKNRSSASERVTVGETSPSVIVIQEESSLPDLQTSTGVQVYEDLTDQSGEPVEGLSDGNAEGETTETTADTTKSILEAYAESHTTTYARDATEPTTEYIEPATKIVIEIG